MEALASHEDTAEHKQASQRMELKRRAGKGRSERDVLENPVLRDEVCHERSNGEGRWNGSSFEVLRLSSCILWKSGNGDVESSEASKTAEDEEGEEEVIDWSTKTDCESCNSWGNSEGDQISQRVLLLTHQTTLSPPSRNHSVKKIEEEAERHESQSSPQVPIVRRFAKTVSQAGENGHNTTEAIEFSDDIGKVKGSDEREVGVILRKQDLLLIDSWQSSIFRSAVDDAGASSLRHDWDGRR